MRQAVREHRLRWRSHAVERMLARAIHTPDVLDVLLNGEIIEDYPDDSPYPSALVLGTCGSRTLHVVVAYAAGSGYAYVVTAYEPDREHFEADFRRRKTDE